MTDYYDDLGVDGGRFEFRHGGYAKAAVRNWSIAAYGNRPQDYLQRDLLFGSFQRDPRLWMWRKLCKHKPPWMFEDTLGFHKSQRIDIARQRSFHLLHQAHWLDLLDFADDESQWVIGQLRSCPPVGSKVDWTSKNPKPRGNCRRKQHCPFCFARGVLKIYQRTVQGLRPTPYKRGFFLLTATVTEDELHESGIENPYQYARRSLVPAMQAALKTLGARGGLLTVQVGPHKWDSPHWANGELMTTSETGLEFHLGVLGEFPVNQKILSTLRSQRDAHSISVGGVTIHPNLSVLNHLSDNSLRILLAGHMSSYNADQSVIGGRGLFVWPSLILANYSQWKKRFELLKDTHLYDCWGSWIGMTPVCRQPHLPRGRRPRIGLARSRDTIRNINNGRKRVVDHRIDDLWMQHGGLLRLLSENAGRPIGRSMIISRLVEEGFTISDKDSRRLAKRLKQEMQI